MTLHLSSLLLTAADVAAFDDALEAIERFVKPLRALSAEEATRLTPMSERSEQFCRQAAMLLEFNREILPAPFGLTELHDDLTAFDVLRPRMSRLKAALARLDETQLMLGSDIMTAALEGYSLMQQQEEAVGLSVLQQTMARPRSGHGDEHHPPL